MSSMHAPLTFSRAALSSRVRRLSSRLLAPVDLALHQKRQALVDAQLAGGAAAGVVGQRGDHAVQAQGSELGQGLFVEHGAMSFVCEAEGHW
jgi:hypothetical protein